MGFTYERKIDALGGVESARGTEGAKSADWIEGYNEAVADASAIGSDADEMIAELTEAIDDVLLCRHLSLRKWAEEAELLMQRIRARVA